MSAPVIKTTTSTTADDGDVVTIRGTSVVGNPFTYIGPVDETSKACGKGRRNYDNGGVYEGDFENGDMNGHGTYTYADRAVYVGEWVADQREGHGTMTCADGHVYVGEWVADQRDYDMGRWTCCSCWTVA